MTPITFEEWQERFAVKPSAADEEDTVVNDPDSYVFYDNGAVRDFDENFIIKADEVQREP